MAPMLRALWNDSTSCHQQLEALTPAARTRGGDVVPCQLHEVLFAPKIRKHSSFLCGPEAIWRESAGRSAGWPVAFSKKHARPPRPVHPTPMTGPAFGTGRSISKVKMSQHEPAEAADKACVSRPLDEVPDRAKCEHARCDLRMAKNCDRNECCKLQHAAEPAGPYHGHGSKGHDAAPLATPATSPERAAHEPAATDTASKEPALDPATHEKSAAHIKPKDPAAPEHAPKTVANASPSEEASADPDLAPQQVQTQHAEQKAATHPDSHADEHPDGHRDEHPDRHPDGNPDGHAVTKHPDEEPAAEPAKHTGQEPAAEPAKHPGEGNAAGTSQDKVGSNLNPACCLCNNGEVTWTQTGHCSHCDDKGHGAALRLDAPLSCQPGSDSWPMDAEKGWTDEDDSMGRNCSETCREIFQAEKSASHHEATASTEAAAPTTATSAAESVLATEEEAAAAGAEEDATSAEVETTEAEKLNASPDVVEPALTTPEPAATTPTDANA